ncbi:MAG: hypothetical protein NTU88_17510 [Armatimonadetes bacterium]|nr:hypothetical protein [Armatimonadota bacterium]
MGERENRGKGVWECGSVGASRIQYHFILNILFILFSLRPGIEHRESSIENRGHEVTYDKE